VGIGEDEDRTDGNGARTEDGNKNLGMVGDGDRYVSVQLSTARTKATLGPTLTADNDADSVGRQGGPTADRE